MLDLQQPTEDEIRASIVDTLNGVINTLAPPIVEGDDYRISALRKANRDLAHPILDTRRAYYAGLTVEQLKTEPVFILFDPLAAPSNQYLAAAACDCLDYQVGLVRSLLVSNGNYVQEEYRLAYDEARAWVDAGSKPGSVPESVQIWADSDYDGDAEAAAANIIETRERFNQVLNGLRDVRLKGKAAIKAAQDPSSLDEAYNGALYQLEGLKSRGQ